MRTSLRVQLKGSGQAVNPLGLRGAGPNGFPRCEKVSSLESFLEFQKTEGEQRPPNSCDLPLSPPCEERPVLLPSGKPFFNARGAGTTRTCRTRRLRSTAAMQETMIPRWSPAWRGRHPSAKPETTDTHARAGARQVRQSAWHRCPQADLLRRRLLRVQIRGGAPDPDLTREGTGPPSTHFPSDTPAPLRAGTGIN